MGRGRVPGGAQGRTGAVLRPLGGPSFNGREGPSAFQRREYDQLVKRERELSKAAEAARKAHNAARRAMQRGAKKGQWWKQERHQAVLDKYRDARAALADVRAQRRKLGKDTGLEE